MCKIYRGYGQIASSQCTLQWPSMMDGIVEIAEAGMSLDLNISVEKDACLRRSKHARILYTRRRRGSYNGYQNTLHMPSVRQRTLGPIYRPTGCCCGYKPADCDASFCYRCAWWMAPNECPMFYLYWGVNFEILIKYIYFGHLAEVVPVLRPAIIGLFNSRIT